MIQALDAHTHIDFSAFDADREEVIARMREAGVGAMVVGVDLETSREAAKLAATHDHLWATIGLHPVDNKTEVFDPASYAELLGNPRVVGVGECGLDFNRAKEEGEREAQRVRFSAQLNFALERDKPLMIHCRDALRRGEDEASAHEEMLTLLARAKKEAGTRLRGNTHFFTAPLAVALQYFELGFTISFSGVVTFAKEYHRLVKEVPLSQILVETDAPFAAPVPHRGKRNEPIYVLDTIRTIATIRGVTPEEVADATLQNARRIFNL